MHMLVFLLWLANGMACFRSLGSLWESGPFELRCLWHKVGTAVMCHNVARILLGTSILLALHRQWRGAGCVLHGYGKVCAALCTTTSPGFCAFCRMHCSYGRAWLVHELVLCNPAQVLHCLIIMHCHGPAAQVLRFDLCSAMLRPRPQSCVVHHDQVP